VDTLVFTGFWTIGYATTGDPADQAGARVVAATAPPGGGPTSPPTPWRFGSFGPYMGSAAAGACVADPRQAALSCDADAANDGAYETQTQLTWSARAIRTTAPAAGPTGQTYRRISTFVWDNHNNLLCARTPEANAIQASCTSGTDLDAGGYSTTHTYESAAPWRRVSTTHPAPATGAERLSETLSYDHLSSFNGLWAEIYPNALLQGTPPAEGVWGDLDQDWNTGAPAGAGSGDYWSVRLSGYLNLTDMSGGAKYQFRIYSDDGVNLMVGGTQLLGCFGTVRDETHYHCGTDQNVSKRLWPGMRPFSIELSELTGDAALDVRWDQGTGDWQTIPAWMVNTDLGLLTRRISARTDAGGTTNLRNETWTYPSDDDKARRLWVDDSVIDPGTGGPDTTTRQSHDDYGRVATRTLAYGTPEASTTTTAYFDGDPTWLTGTQQVSCPVSMTDGSGALTTFECSPAGDTTRSTRTVDAVDRQPAQTRTATTLHDSLGRVVRVTSPRGATTTTTYDRSGRPLTVAQLIATGTTATTSYAYDHAGHLKTETAPDPDGTGPLSSPVTTHAWNWLDLETQMTDPRGKLWSTTYDALGRVLTRTSPLGAVTSTAYRLGTAVNETVVTEPSGADTVTKADVLGRTISVQLESYSATTTAYDVFGSPTLVTDPAGVRTKSVCDGLGRVTSRISFEGTAQAATTTFAYDDRGLVTESDGPRSGGIDDRTQLGYDGAGRLTSVSQPGVTLPGSTTPVSVQITYDDAGERVRVVQPMTTTTSVDRHWTYDTDGNVATSIIERAGVDKTTTFTTNLAGWVTQIADPRPTTVHQGFDDLGRRVCRHTAACTGGTSGAETWAYDAAGNMTQAKNPTIELNLLYDDDGRLTTTKRGTTTETTFTYSVTTALLTSVADAAGTTTFTYNAAAQVATLDDPLTTSGLTTYGYDTAGRPSTRTDGQANLTWTRTYEPNTGRVDTQTIKNTSTQGVLASFDLGYDAASNVTSKASSVFSNPSNGTWSYQYDAAGRMTLAVGPNATGAQTTWTYGFDGASSRTSVQTGAGTPVTTTYQDGSGFPLSSTDGTTYTTDDAGNLVQIDRTGTANDWTYGFDAFNRMTCARQGTDCTTASGKITFALDAFDRADARTKDSVTTAYTYRGISETPVKTVTGATTTTYASSAGGDPVAQKTGSATRFLLTDLHSDTVGLVDTAASNQATMAYDPWGSPLGVTGTETTWFGFQSDPTDPDTRQVDMGARWYEAGVGRFSARDVLFGDAQVPASLNQFAYANGAPVTFWDPDGLAACEAGMRCPPGGMTDPKVWSQWAKTQQRIQEHTCWSCYGLGDYESPSHVKPKPPGPKAGPITGPRALVTHLTRVASDGRVSAFESQSLAHLEWATEIGGADCAYFAKADFWRCVNARGASNGPRNVLTIGNVIVSDQSRINPNLLKHELGHVKQGRALGAVYIPAYVASEALARMLNPMNSNCNIMEVGAGPGGGYEPCRPRALHPSFIWIPSL
jgi:RHS repeat-associated protein